MKKYIYAIIIPALVHLAVYAGNGNNNPDDEFMDRLRLKYYECVENEEAMTELEEILFPVYGSENSEQSAIIVAYQGAFEALKAKHAFWPFTKMSYLDKSMNILRTAIDMEPNNLEIRFLRFSILHHVPGILGYSEETGEDAGVIYDLIVEGDENVDTALQRGFAEFLIHSERLTEDQNHKLRRKFALAKLDE